MALPPEDVAAIRAAEADLALALNDPDPTAWVVCYTEDAIFPRAQQAGARRT